MDPCFFCPIKILREIQKLFKIILCINLLYIYVLHSILKFSSIYIKLYHVKSIFEVENNLDNVFEVILFLFNYIWKN